MNIINHKNIIKTEDGSSTFYIPSLKETYHSVHGAVNESMHVFIDKGAKYFTNERDNLRIIEVGFGTGLNALLTYIESERINVKSIDYYALEPYPISNDQLEQLNYTSIIDKKDGDAETFFEKIHSFQEEGYFEMNNFRFHFHKLKIQDFISDLKFDLVYFDAFAPHAQPEMWEYSVFIDLFNMMDPNSILVTYCAKGNFKRALKKAGFKVEELEGPPGKREMVRGMKEGGS
ncbi:MAG: tRNA (5-methylaminomethyl-2-thiouridine)(34)-methyltransferase MnmD [Flavobacteriales bacterium]